MAFRVSSHAAATVTVPTLWSLRTHAPLRAQHLVRLGGREDLVAGQAADSSRAAAQGAELRGRDAAPVAPYAPGFAHVVAVGLEPPGRREVEGGKGARLA